MTFQEYFSKICNNSEKLQKLHTDPKSHKEIIVLQKILFQLGFSDELNWEKYGADGIYGSSTSQAVLAFAERNGIESDGSFVSAKLANLMQKRLQLLEDIKVIDNLVISEKIDNTLVFGTNDRLAVKALQVLLNEIGYGNELQWDIYRDDGIYGKATMSAVEAFASERKISSKGDFVTGRIGEELLEIVTRFYGERWKTVSPKKKSLNNDLIVTEKMEEGKERVYVSDGETEIRFTKFKEGVYYFGKCEPIEFVKKNEGYLKELNISDSQINVITAVSQNEGNLEAINTWDNAFLTFGMFQWTIGTGTSKGELPALLKKIKETHLLSFQKYFGKYGVDIIETDPQYGYLTLNGKKISDPIDKDRFRDYQWPFYFCKAGLDTLIQAIEIEHALSRIDTFYHADNYKVEDYYIDEIITSEYGVALILDNHVNRPAYVAPCLSEALRNSKLENPSEWGTNEEKKIINSYLEIRKTYGKYPMTDAESREENIKAFVTKGILSSKRDSYK